jgi:DNA-directed RNA polymerase subunit RPC12/RpoP
MIIEKVPMLRCEKCGSIRVLNTDDGIECEDCDNKPNIKLSLSDEVEYLVYELQSKEIDNETF